MQKLMEVNAQINAFVWGPVMLIFIVCVGFYFTLRLKLFQITKIKYWIKYTIGLLFKGRKKSEAGAVTPFQAFTTAMAATAGTGNLVGVSTALIAGGPGAVLWMWISGFFGMMTKYAEILLAVLYRRRNERGEWVGGPMYYITSGMGGNCKWLAVLFAIFGSLCAFGIGNMTQINSIIGTTETMLVDLNVIDASAAGGYSNFKLILGIVLALLVAQVLLGGMKRIGNVTEFLVPFIGIACILGCIAAIIIKRENLPEAISMIFEGAFQTKAAAGGVLGYTLSQAIRFGVARGVFTNEAGLGSAPIAHAAADVDHPVKQGLWGCFEVFADTLVMSTLSAMVVLTSGEFQGTETLLDGTQLISAAFKASFGIGGSIFMAFSVLIFAYCTCLSWSLYGLRCFEFLTKGKGGQIYQGFYCAIVVIGAIMQLNLVWDIADTLNGLMAIPNLIALIVLSPKVLSLTKDYFVKM
ncbi:MAG: alanine/glycine:cation symporter family protein [Lachnospiraceae bacterium]